MVQAALAGEQVEAIAAHLGLARNTVYLWLHRFEAKGLAGRGCAAWWPSAHLQSGTGRGNRGDGADRSADLRLAVCVLDARPVGGVPEGVQGDCHEAQPSHEVLLTEGLRWRQQETWFGERVDPNFAAKRGR